MVCFSNETTTNSIHSPGKARQGKQSCLVLSKTTQLSQAFIGTFLWATKGSSGCRSASSPCFFYPSLGILRLSSCCPQLTHHSPFWWRNKRNRHKGNFLFLLFAFSEHLSLIFFVTTYFIIGI